MIGTHSDGIEYGAVAGVQLHEQAEIGALAQRRPQPVLGAIGAVGVHVRLELHHAEAELFCVALDLGDAVVDAPARIVDEAAVEPVGVLLHGIDRVLHVMPDRVAPGLVSVEPGVDGVALRRLDERLVDAARLAVHPRARSSS